MRYLCLIHLDPTLLAGLSQADGAELDRQCQAYDEGLLVSGHYVTAVGLKDDGAKLVRRRAGMASVTDGPYVETKEQLAGFILLEAADLDEALDLALRSPLASYGSIEVRPEAGLEWQHRLWARAAGR